MSCVLKYLMTKEYVDKIFETQYGMVPTTQTSYINWSLVTFTVYYIFILLPHDVWFSVFCLMFS
jgi:hypothetical protein